VRFIKEEAELVEDVDGDEEEEVGWVEESGAFVSSCTFSCTSFIPLSKKKKINQ